MFNSGDGLMTEDLLLLLEFGHFLQEGGALKAAHGRDGRDRAGWKTGTEGEGCGGSGGMDCWGWRRLELELLRRIRRERERTTFTLERTCCVYYCTTTTTKARTSSAIRVWRSSTSSREARSPSSLFPSHRLSALAALSESHTHGPRGEP